MQFSFMPGWASTNAIFCLKIVTRELFDKEEKFVLWTCTIWETFSSNAKGCCMVGFEETKCRRVVGLDFTVNV